MGEIARAIRADEYEQCLNLWMAVWPEDGRQYFARYFFGDSEFQPEYTRVIEVDGRLVSAAHIVKRTVSCGEFDLTMGGIANVATLPEYRRRGFSRLCLEQAVQVMEADAFDFSLLFTDIHKLYEGVGWEQSQGEYFLGSLKKTITPPYGRISIRPYEERDNAAIQLIYSEFNAARPIAVRRSGPYWRDWIGLWRGAAPGKAFIAELEGSVVGYCVYGLQEDTGTGSVLEFGVRRGAESAVHALFAAVATEALAKGVSLLHFPLHRNQHVNEALRSICEEPIEEAIRVSDSAMVRLLHRNNLIAGLAPSLTSRWMAAGSPAGRITFTGPYGATRLESSDGFLKVVDLEIPRPGESVISQSGLLHLLIGRGIAQLGYTGSAKEFAAALFPSQDSWFWQLDGF